MLLFIVGFVQKNTFHHHQTVVRTAGLDRMSVFLPRRARLPAGNRHRKRRTAVCGSLSQTIRCGLHRPPRTLARSAYGHELYRHSEGVALPSRNKFIWNEFSRFEAACPGRRCGRHLAFLPAASAHRRYPCRLDWMHASGGGCNLFIDRRIRLGSGSISALVAARRPAVGGAILPAQALARALLGMLYAGLGNVG